MNDEDATRLLNQLAERVQVGPAPIPDVLRSGRETRAHRRRTTVFAVAASVALVLIGGIGVRQALQPSGMAPAAGTNQATAPAGTRLVGIGHAAIAVPKDWGTNQTRCGTPRANTVVIDQGAVDDCMVVQPRRVSDVEVQVASDVRNLAGFAAATAVSVDGVPALKTPLRCTSERGLGPHRSQMCTQALWIEQEQALFTVTSPHASTVRGLLHSVRVDPKYVAVPVTYTADATRDARAFTLAASSLGLQVDTRVARGSRWPAGSIISVEPDVGTLLSPGDTVHVTVAAGAPSGQGTAAPLTRPASWCPVSAGVQRLVVTRSLLPGNGISFSFPSRVRVHDPAAIARLVKALCAAPRIPKGAVYNCPFDNGLAYHVTAFDGGTKAWAVDVHASGCRMTNGMGRGWRNTGRVWHALASAMGVSPPTYKTLAGTPAGH